MVGGVFGEGRYVEYWELLSVSMFVVWCFVVNVCVCLVKIDWLLGCLRGNW